MLLRTVVLPRSSSSQMISILMLLVLMSCRCETETNECLSSPCLNNGTCIDRFNNFTCNCTSGFTGHRCDVDIDDCVINPCQNNASCIDGINTFICSCTSGFTGKFCDSDIDECAGEIIGTLTSEDATAAKTSLKKCTCVLSVFIAIIPVHILC